MILFILFYFILAPATVYAVSIVDLQHRICNDNRGLMEEIVRASNGKAGPESTSMSGVYKQHQ